jgi:hypothetical protein
MVVGMKLTAACRVAGHPRARNVAHCQNSARRQRSSLTMADGKKRGIHGLNSGSAREEEEEEDSRGAGGGGGGGGGGKGPKEVGAPV